MIAAPIPVAARPPQQRVVLRPQHDPRLDAVRAQVALDDRVGAARAVGDEVELAEVLRASARPAGCPAGSTSTYGSLSSGT